MAASSLFRANPRRCIYVTGEIGQDLVSRLTPAILTLQADSREPITVYIDSPGGDVVACQRILELLRAPSQGSQPPCRLITVATHLAASAAALLLCEGDYALSYPGAVIYFHGTRFQLGTDLTLEVTPYVGERLRSWNDQSASKLALRGFARLAFQFLRWRVSDGSEGIEAFVTAIRQQCGPGAWPLVDGALKRNRDYQLLVDLVRTEVRCEHGETGARFEAALLQFLVGRQVEEPNQDLPLFSEGGLLTLTRNFHLALESLGVTNDPDFDFAAEAWGPWLLSENDRITIAAMPADQQPAEREQRASQRSEDELRPLWTLEAALCHTLQTGEFQLSPREAFLLGFIDEEIGGADVTLRDLVEKSQPSPVPEG